MNQVMAIFEKNRDDVLAIIKIIGIENLIAIAPHLFKIIATYQAAK